MDVNKTRFHLLLLGAEAYSVLLEEEGAVDDDLEQGRDGRPMLTLSRRVFRFPAAPSDAPPRPEDRRGADRDRFGNWYWIADDGAELRASDHERRYSSHFWSADDVVDACAPDDGSFSDVTPAADPIPLALAGLAVTEDHHLVVGSVEPPGLMIFDLHGGGPPIFLYWPPEVDFIPFDIARRPGGGVWILDRENGRYWALDGRLQVIPTDQGLTELLPEEEEDFGPVGGEPRVRGAVTFPEGIRLDLSSPVAAVNPQGIEALPDGTVLILDADPDAAGSTLLRYSYGVPIHVHSLDDALAEVLTDPDPDSVAIRAHDLAFVPAVDEGDDSGDRLGTLYLVASDGNQGFAFDVTEAADDALGYAVQARYLPMRLYHGRALVAAAGRAYYDQEDRWLPLVEQPRPRYAQDGQLTTRILDGRRPACVWHRLMLDGCIPSGAAVAVESRASDDPALLLQTPWQAEPTPYRRGDGCEVPWVRLYDGAPGAEGTFELLFQRARGRYLQLRLTLTGNGRVTPRLYALRAWYPRFSYLDAYMPAVYREDPASAWFLDRFLANLEGLNTAIEGRIAQAQVLMDPRTVPPEYTDWLGSWLGLSFEADWDTARRRLLLAHAIELYNQRGTLPGLLRAIRLAIDPCPGEELFTEDPSVCASCTEATGAQVRTGVRIIESFLTRDAPGVVYGDPSDSAGPGVTTEASDWTPSLGAAPLHEAWRAYLAGVYGEGDAGLAALNAAWGASKASFYTITLSPVVPAGAAEAADWEAFIDDHLGFTYAHVTGDDMGAWRSFLARRYRRIGELNAAWGLSAGAVKTAFTSVDLPAEGDFPASGARLFDWIQFVSLALPIAESAHRYAVLVPAAPGEDTATIKARQAVVERVVELEGPAHAAWEVRPYWDMFRVGEVRLGLDTVLDRGSRFTALVLGEGYLASSWLAPGHPFDVTDRFVVGRERVTS